jgi:hypothetical protein
MFEAKENETTFEHIFRLSARGASIACLAIIFFFFLGEGIDFGNVSANEWVGLAFFPIGVLIGLVLAWREEFLGGLITLISIASFYLVYGWLLNSSIRQGWAFLPFAIPGILFMVYGWLRTARHHIVAH